jgi:hypothetical protein
MAFLAQSAFKRMALVCGVLFHICAPIDAADVLLFSLVKSQGWQQTGPAEIARSGGDKFVFQAGIIEAAPGRVGTASVRLPVTSIERALSRANSSAYDLTYANSSPPTGGPEITTIAGFDAAYPNGTYMLRVSTANDGTRVLSGNLDGDAYPTVPQVSNFADAQQIDPRNPFTVSWFPFVNGTTSDFIHLRVVDGSRTIYASGLPGAANALNGTSTGATIPTELLQPGKTYRLILFFAKAVSIDRTSYPGATGYTGYGQTLYTTIRTIGSPMLPPTIITQPTSQSVRLDESAAFSVTATGTEPLLYQWFFNDQVIANGTNALLFISSAQLTDAGTYTVQVTNPAGEPATSQPATLTVTTTTEESFNRVISLDGNGSFVSISSDPSLQNGQAFSLELWCFPTATAGNKFGSIVNKGDGASGGSARSYELRWTPDNMISFNLFMERASDMPDFIALQAPLPSNQWTHVAATFSGATGTAALYTNGVLANEVTNLLGRQIRQTSLPLVLGWTPTFPDTYASGFLDEVRVWAVARTANDIMTDLGCMLTGVEPGLSGYWSFASDTFEDGSGHGLTATATGNVTIIQQPLNEILLSGCDRALIAPVGAPDAVAPRWAVKGRIGASYMIESSSDLLNWKDFISLPDQQGSLNFQPFGAGISREFFRGKKHQ